MGELILAGILISLVYTELTDISPGGLVVPAYLALYLYSPLRILMTCGVSLLCLVIVRLLSNFTILYGRRRFAVYLLTGIVLKMLFGLFYDRGIFVTLSLTIGYVIPGLLARDTERQGFLPTYLSLGVNLGLIRLVQILVTGG